MDGGFESVSRNRWYAVRSQPRKEAFADEQLRRQGFRTFLPRHSSTTRLPTRTKVHLTPFFPGYLFVRLDLSFGRWSNINSTFGVQKIVAFGGRPAPAPHGLIEELIALSGEAGEVRFNQSFSPGESVRIIGGPLHGHIGRFESLRPHERVHILLQILNQETRVEVARTAIMPA